MKEFLVNPNDAGQRLDKFCAKATVGLPKSLLYKAIRTKKIKVNRRRGTPEQILTEGDRVQMFLAPEFFGEKENAFLSLRPNLTVAYEDDDLIVCDKPEGVSCHSDAAQQTGTLIDHIKAYLAEKGEFRPAEENSFAPALCNRIDRNTSGLVIAAKNAVSLREMSEMIRERRVEKIYLAWIHGAIPSAQTVTVYLKKHADENRVEVSPTPKPGYLTAITEIRPVCRKGDRELVEIRLHTGRTHQIRATLAYLGHPLVGDAKYGKGRDAGFSHQALRAARLVFHPAPDSGLFRLDGVEIDAPEDPRFQPEN